MLIQKQLKVDQLLRELVKIESVSGNEKQISGFLVEYLNLNKDYEVYTIGLNVICKIKGEKSQNCIIMNAHIDTVDTGNISQWKVDPFGSDSNDKIIYGLGSIDDKACVAAMIKAVEVLTLESDLILMFVREEEIDGKGTKEVLEFFKNKGTLETYKKIFAIVGEPTNLETIKTAHRGSIFFDLEIFGDSGHGSRPQDVKVSAIENSANFALKMNEMNEYLGINYSNEQLGIPTICITNIIADSGSPNKIAGISKITLDLRTTPELEKADYKEIISGYLGSIEFKINEISNTPVGYTPNDSELIKKLKELKYNLSVADFASDMSWFSYFGIDCIILGPGDPSFIHKPDEHIDVDELEDGVAKYQELLKVTDGI